MSEIWTGEINRPYAFEAEVGFYDTTLRDGEQTVGVVLDPQQKLEIALGLAEAGVERIEAGFPRVSSDDWEAVRLIAEAGLAAEIWGFSRAVRADVEALVELGVKASVIESPISDLKLGALGVTARGDAQAHPRGRLVRGGERDHGRLLRRRLHARRPGLLRRGLRGRGRGGRR